MRGGEPSSLSTSNCSSETSGPGGLTPRQLELLGYLARGFSVKECAALLAISPHTVAWYVKEIYRKLSVNSRQEAVYEAVQAGWIQLTG